MVVEIASTNPLRRRLVRQLIKLSRKEGRRVWRRVAEELARPRRNRRAVNISRINRHVRESEVAVVPGRVLGAGMLERPVTVIAESFTLTAIEKIRKAGGKPITIRQLVESEDARREIEGRRLVLIG